MNKYVFFNALNKFLAQRVFQTLVKASNNFIKDEMMNNAKFTLTNPS